MSTQTKNGANAQGAEALSINKEKVREWMKRDLGFAINLLQAIYSDPDMVESICDFMIGRFENAKAKEALHKEQPNSEN